MGWHRSRQQGYGSEQSGQNPDPEKRQTMNKLTVVVLSFLQHHLCLLCHAVAPSAGSLPSQSKGACVEPALTRQQSGLVRQPCPTCLPRGPDKVLAGESGQMQPPKAPAQGEVEALGGLQPQDPQPSRGHPPILPGQTQRLRRVISLNPPDRTERQILLLLCPFYKWEVEARRCSSGRAEQSLKGRQHPRRYAGPGSWQVSDRGDVLFGSLCDLSWGLCLPGFAPWTHGPTGPPRQTKEGPKLGETGDVVLTGNSRAARDPPASPSTWERQAGKPVLVLSGDARPQGGDETPVERKQRKAPALVGEGQPHHCHNHQHQNGLWKRQTLPRLCKLLCNYRGPAPGPRELEPAGR
ncbi:PREDICTED: uncharacterized protein LOC102003016 [Chinchilla lanigera]|uniref:uncharacterized protein LOC102003016 n=1 Tax=Chinchilla lanigera TaxID=34839 RepID=UPI000695A8B1|nr:PREDICTED: uncharacterized protein LOC102003016 [Chinchilla lanigera]